MTPRLLAAAAAAVALVLAGCSAAGTPTPDPGASITADATAPAGTPAADDASTLLADYGLDGLDAREVVDRLDRLGGDDRPADLMASIRADEIVLSDGARETTLAMPDDAFYVSMAPYVDQTHDCFFHSLTTCQGEMVGEDVQVTVVDDATGEVLLDEATTTFANGFVGVWLPRDITGTVELRTADGSVEAPISTTADSATCLTTLRLA